MQKHAAKILWAHLRVLAVLDTAVMGLIALMKTNVLPDRPNAMKTLTVLTRWVHMAAPAKKDTHASSFVQRNSNVSLFVGGRLEVIFNKGNVTCHSRYQFMRLVMRLVSSGSMRKWNMSTS